MVLSVNAIQRTNCQLFLSKTRHLYYTISLFSVKVDSFLLKNFMKNTKFFLKNLDKKTTTKTSNSIYQKAIWGFISYADNIGVSYFVFSNARLFVAYWRRVFFHVFFTGEVFLLLWRNSVFSLFAVPEKFSDTEKFYSSSSNKLLLTKGGALF